MSLFFTLFSGWIQFSYHCFDRVILKGYISILSRPENIVYWIREIHGIAKVTQDFLQQRTKVYQGWVESHAAKQGVPIEWATDQRNEERLRPFLNRARKQKKFGVYHILKSMEQGPAFHCKEPKYPTNDPDYTIVHRVRRRYTFYYFYIYDEVLGPIYLRIGSYLPFEATAYFNGHGAIVRQLQKTGIKFTEKENSITSVEDPVRLQEFAESLSAEQVEERINYWTHRLGPKFSAKERERLPLKRYWCFSQVEYCCNLIFKRNRPIRDYFIRSCDLGLMTLTTDRISNFFGRRINRRFKGKLHCVMQRMDQSRHVLRAYYKSSFVKQYEKWRTYLRVEIVSNNVKDLGVRKKGLCILEELRDTMQGVVERYAQTSAVNFNNAGQFDLLAQLSRSVRCGATQVAGIRIDNGRIARLLSLLVRGGPGNLRGWTSRELHQAALKTFDLTERQYTLNQLRYDLRKLKAHDIVTRIPGSHCYRLNDRGGRTAILFIQVRRKLYGPVAKCQLIRRPDSGHLPDSDIERAYEDVNASIDRLTNLLAA